MAEQRFAEEYPDEDAEGKERPYETQYTGMLGRSPGQIEIDTSDADLGRRWQAQLAALEARLDTLTPELERQQLMDHLEGMQY